MFDLFRSRQKAVRYLLGGLLLMVAASMVTYLIPGMNTGSSSSNSKEMVLAEVGGEKITVQEIMARLQRAIQSGQVPRDMVDVLLPQIIEEMIQHKALLYEFEKRQGLTVTDDEVLAGMAMDYPSYFKDGALVDKDKFEQIAAQNGLTLQDIVDQEKDKILRVKIENIVYSTVIVTDKEVEEQYKRDKEKAKIQYIAFPAAKFREDVKPSAEEMHKYFDANRAQYMTPEKRTFQVLIVDQVKIEAAMVIPDADLHAAYTASMDNFRSPDRVKARHILIKTEGMSDAQKKQALAKAEDLLKQAKAGADFSALATKNSEDTGSGQKGGDLGWFVRGQMVPEFEKAAFAMKPGEISGIVTSQFGYHIIKLDEKENARVKPFEEVKAELATELKKQRVTEKIQTLADQSRADLVKSPHSAAEIAKKYNIEVVTVTNAAPGSPVPTLGSVPEIDSALATMKPNDVSQVVALPANRLVVAVLNDRVAPRQSTFEEVEAQVREHLMSVESLKVAGDRAKDAATKLRAGEDIEKLAKSMKLEVASPAAFGHADSIDGLGQAIYLKDAFTQPPGSIIGPLNIQGRDIVCKLVERDPADMSALSAEKDTIRQTIRKQKLTERYNLFLDSVVSKLEADGKLKIHNDAITKLGAALKRG